MGSIDRSVWRRRGVVAAALAAIPIVGYLDGLTSAYIAFSIFYAVPVILCAWFGSRKVAIFAAALAALSGLVADVWSIGARPIYTYVNLGSRLTLFVVFAFAFSRLRRAAEAQEELARTQQELARQQTELGEIRRNLMANVVQASRAPLSEIYAKVVDFSFENRTLSPDDARDLMRELASASMDLSHLIETLDKTPEQVSSSDWRNSA